MDLSQELASRIPPRLAAVPAFPAVAIKLLSLLADEESTISSIAGCIATDPVLCGQLIKRARASDHYCEPRNVFQAVVALGIDRTRELGLAIAMSAYAGSAIKSEILRPFWRHTLACALAASEIARQCGLRPAEPYTAALMHDIGRLGLLAAYPREYEEMMTGPGGDPDDLRSIERERFGLDHVEAGLWLARRWDLPESIVEVVCRHYEAPTTARDQVAVVQISCRLADQLGFSVGLPGEPPNLGEIAATLPEWTHLRLGTELQTLQDAIAREIQIFEASEAPQLGSPTTIVDGGEPEEEPSVRRFPHTVPAWMTALRHSQGVIVGAVVVGIVLLLSAALYIRH
jgi:putative nucleotidyltransferase with HDIG domain